jgi:hypothetical protein
VIRSLFASRAACLLVTLGILTIHPAGALAITAHDPFDSQSANLCAD